MKPTTAYDGAWVRSLRGPRPRTDPWRLLDFLWEEERQPDGAQLPVLTLFLAGAECPFTCVFCDLWRHTTPESTPRGAIPAQIRQGLEAAGPLPPVCGVKLYNASNFFEERAVPWGDDEDVIALLRPFERVTVECHPRLVGRRCFDFASALAGRLEVAMGLETVHPEAQPRLGKAMTVDDFDDAAGALRERGIDLRAFVLLAPPFVAAGEVVQWAVRSVEHALQQGARRVSVIPTRMGNGATERLLERGELTLPSLDQLEETLDHCWDLRLAPPGPPGQGDVRLAPGQGDVRLAPGQGRGPEGDVRLAPGVRAVEGDVRLAPGQGDVRLAPGVPAAAGDVRLAPGGSAVEGDVRLAPGRPAVAGDVRLAPGGSAVEGDVRLAPGRGGGQAPGRGGGQWGGVVEADLWDASSLFAGTPCVEERLARLRRLNRSGLWEPRHRCPRCQG